MLQTFEQKSRAKLAATIVSVLVIAGLVVTTDQLKSHTQAGTPAHMAAPLTTASTSMSTTASAGHYKDGTYSASSSYAVPHGEEQIQVNLTLKNDTITDLSVQNSENNFDSASFQEGFASVYKSYVVGKKISGLQLGAVGGASDTTQGFNDALNRIASQAQA